LFFKKYEQFIDAEKFLIYFKKQWCDKNFLWYEGAATFYPSTNNAMERFNLRIKEEYFEWERLSMCESLLKCKDMIKTHYINNSSHNFDLIIATSDMKNPDDYYFAKGFITDEFVYTPMYQKQSGC
jgi:hypothetical protein